MDKYKGLFAFLAICVYAFAVIGGTAYLFADHHAIFGVANLLLAAMAFPFVREQIKKFFEQ